MYRKPYLYSLVLRELNTFRSRLTVNYSGLENIVERGYKQTIYAINHPSRFDPFIMIPSIDHYVQNKNQVHIPAAQWIKEKFHRLYKLHFFDWLGISFLSDNDKERNKQVLRHLEECLRTYKHIMIFPEGWVERDGKIRPGMYGTSSLAMHCATPEENVDIIPIAITYYMKPRPKRRERLRGWFDIIWNLDEYLLDTIVEAKQYYHAEIDIVFGRPVSANSVKEQGLDEASTRRLITNAMMRDIGQLISINSNQLLAQYFIKGIDHNRRWYGRDRIDEDMAAIVHSVNAKGYHVHCTDVPGAVDQTLELFDQQNLVRKRRMNGSDIWIVNREFLTSLPEPSDEEYREKNFLHYTANQIAHLDEISTIIRDVQKA